MNYLEYFYLTAVLDLLANTVACILMYEFPVDEFLERDIFLAFAKLKFANCEVIVELKLKRKKKQEKKKRASEKEN